MIKRFGEKSFELRPLTRRELKDLRRKGFNLSNIDTKNADECFEEVVSTVLSEETIEEAESLSNPDYMDLYRTIVKMTFDMTDAEKNSSMSGAASATEK